MTVAAGGQWTRAVEIRQTCRPPQKPAAVSDGVIVVVSGQKRRLTCTAIWSQHGDPPMENDGKKPGAARLARPAFGKLGRLVGALALVTVGFAAGAYCYKNSLWPVGEGSAFRSAPAVTSSISVMHSARSGTT